MHRPPIPSATYRLQFSPDFGFAEARRLIPYLEALGISDVYASPLLAPRTGSTHGYDVVDPLHLNPALGTEEEFEAFTSALREAGMGLLLDIVPNHMAATAENPWWRDLLRYGPGSPYAEFFDVAWDEPPHRILLPILGEPYADVLESGQLRPVRVADGFSVFYFEHEFPLAPRTWERILGHRTGVLDAQLGRQHPGMAELLRLLRDIEALPPGAAGWSAGEAVREATSQLLERHEPIAEHVDDNLARLAGEAGDPSSFDALDELLDAQSYRLAYWRLASEHMNYRRFFDNTDLVGVRVEERRVFDLTHRRIRELVDDGAATGLRVDHIDGLRDPERYLERLQDLGGDGFYVVVEKILSGRERLPDHWPVSGTTGYEFSRALDDALVDARGLPILNRVYGRFIGGQPAFSDLVYARKKDVVDRLFGSEMQRLGRRLCLLAMEDRYGRDIHWAQLHRALREVSVCLPVYRTYVRDEVSERDRSLIEAAFEEAGRRAPEVSEQAFGHVRRVLLLDRPGRHRDDWLDFVHQWQQLTSPLTAKGIEDTALYQYNRLLSLNSVGGEPEPEASELGVDALHRHNRRTLSDWPRRLNSTSTHDSKRSEDVRARLHVLSEITTTFARALPRWRRLNQDRKRRLDGQEAPDHNEEYLLYQTLLGAWPLGELDRDRFRERLQEYVVKAAREAKVNTSWRRQNHEHERALTDFVAAILDDEEFVADFRRFHERVAYFGAINALSAALLKATSPGVPDFYQGTELWTFTLVDPDNRRPVDFEARARALEIIRARAASDPRGLARELLASWPDGRVKMYVIHQALASRNQHRALFERGEYLPVPVSGHRNKHVCAFVRRHGDDWCLVAAPVRVARFTSPDNPPIGKRTWKNTTLRLPEGAPTEWRDALTGNLVRAHDRLLDIRRAFSHLPLFLGFRS